MCSPWRPTPHRYAPLVETSALNGDGLDAALDLVCEAGFWRQFRVPRRRLNELFTRMQTLRPLPKVKALKSGQAGRIRVLYVLQVRSPLINLDSH
jgi:predicted GTPase